MGPFMERIGPSVALSRPEVVYKIWSAKRYHMKPIYASNIAMLCNTRLISKVRAD